MDAATTPGTGRLGRGARSAEPPTPTELRRFLASDFARRLAALLIGVLALATLTSSVLAEGGLPAAASGFMRPDATPLSHARVAHQVWAPALALVMAYSVYAWLPWSRGSRRLDVTVYPAVAAVALLAVWLWSVEAGRLRTSAVLSAAVWGLLVLTLVRAGRVGSTGLVDRQVTQLPFAVLLGWMTVMVAVDLALVARRWGRRPWQIPPETWWVLGVVALLAVAMALVRYLPGRVAIGATVAWGLLGVAYARVLGSPRAYGVAVASVVSAVLVLFAAAAVLAWIRTRRLD